MPIENRNGARIGVFVPYTNTNLEPDLMMMRPDGVSLHFARLGGYDEDEVPDEAQMAALGASDMGEPLRLIQGVKPDVVMYGCTSATLAHGPAFDRELAKTIEGQSGAKTVTAAGALVHALKRLGARQIGFASPYVPSLNDEAVAFLAAEGFASIQRAEVNERLGNAGQGALSPDQVLELGQRANHADADTIVLSCTDMRSVEIIEKLEEELDKPVVTSNQAMLFQALELLGGQKPSSGFGCLFERIRA
ncbi:MAG: Asp/Glu racemase [Pseudomonadota bacterium]